MSIRVLAIDGSFLKHSDGTMRHTEGRLTTLLRDALGAAENEAERFDFNAEVNLIYLHEVIPELGFYNGDLHRLPKKCIGLFEEILNADAVIFGSPVVWYSTSSLMKSFIEYITVLEHGPEQLQKYFPDRVLKKKRQLSGKLMGIITTCNEDGGQMVANTMAAPLSDMGFHLPKGCMFYQNTNIMERSEDAWQTTYQRLVGQNIVRMFALLHGMQIDPNDWELRKE